MKTLWKVFSLPKRRTEWLCWGGNVSNQEKQGGELCGTSCRNELCFNCVVPPSMLVSSVFSKYVFQSLFDSRHKTGGKQTWPLPSMGFTVEWWDRF